MMFGWLKRDKTEEVLDTKEITVDFTDFHKITDFIYEQTGITDLHSRALTPLRLKQYAQEHHIYNSDDFLNELKQKNSFYQKVIDIATVNETYFFREKKELQWLVEYIDKSQKKLKILSMPSSSGEEVYSILLMLLEKKIPLNKVEIRGYDINADVIQNAKKAIYDEHSLYSVDKKTRDMYFTKVDDNKLSISRDIKKDTFFKQQNIFSIDVTKEKYDVILSRNMFIYFDEIKRIQATQIIIDMLNEGGIFIKGHADYIYKNKNLKNIAFGIYKKIYN